MKIYRHKGTLHVKETQKLSEIDIENLKLAWNAFMKEAKRQRELYEDAQGKIKAIEFVLLNN